MRLLLFVTLLCLPNPPAYAGQYTVTYSGGLFTTQGGNMGTTSTPDSMACGRLFLADSYGGAAGDVAIAPDQPNPSPATAACSQQITATFTWQPAFAGEPPPASAVIEQQGTALGAIGGSASDIATLAISDGLGDTASGSPSSTNLSVTRTVYSVQANPGASFSVSCTPSASGTSVNSYVHAGVDYLAAAFPVTVTLGGATQDSGGNLNILVGQSCTSSLSGIPSGCTASNLQWSVDGQTVQASDWTISGDHTHATFSGPNAAYTYTQATLSSPGPSWYWDDTGGSKTITCTTTITPPAGQGSPFPITAKQIVTLKVPIYTNSEVLGAVELDAKYQAQSGINLHAGADGDNIPGVFFNDTVTTPIPPYTSTGTWYRIQLVSVSRYETSLVTGNVVGAPGNGVAGALDVPLGGNAYVYNSQIINADGTTYDPHHNTTAENDSPGFSVSDTQSEYQVKNEKFEDYIMYTPPTPPVGNSITVPLFYYQWSWNADVKIPPAPLPKSWVNWNDAPTGGTITTPGSGSTQRMFIYPTWSSFVNAQLP